MRKSWMMLAACAATAGVVVMTATHFVRVEAADQASMGRDDIVTVDSVYGFAETVERLKADIAAKGIIFFAQIDQAKLAADAGIKLSPSTLLVFGNPPLGTLFITANPLAGLDWPVRLLVHETGEGKVRVAYTTFASIAKRHRITNRDVEFKMASGVVASITSSVTAKR